jgi:hypothetical protein
MEFKQDVYRHHQMCPAEYGSCVLLSHRAECAG